MTDTDFDRRATHYAELYKEDTGFSLDRWCAECEDHPKLAPSPRGFNLVMACGHMPGRFFDDYKDERYCSSCRRYGLHLEPMPGNAPFLINVCSYCGDVAGDTIPPEEAK